MKYVAKMVAVVGVLLVRIDHRRAVRTTVEDDIYHRSEKLCSAALWFCHFVLKTP